MNERFNYLYLLRCSDGSLYCGITTDLKRRIAEHNFDCHKASRYTWSRRPVKLVYSEKHPDSASALKREAQIKKMTKSQKEQLIMLNYSRA